MDHHLKGNLDAFNILIEMVVNKKTLLSNRECYENILYFLFRASRFELSKFNAENIYATLPKSLTEKQLLTKSRFEDPEIQKTRKETTEAKTVAELSQIHSMADFPIPTTIETLIEKGRGSAQGNKDQP